MMKHTLVAFAFILSMLAASAPAQDANPNAQPTGQQNTSPVPPPKTSTPASEAPPQPAQSTTPAANATPPTRERRAAPARTPQQDASDPAVKAVNAAFNTLIDAIRRADAEAAMSVYWKSPHLLIFNYNGTATTTWDQVRANRASSYPKMGNVKLDVRDVRVQLLGRDAALVTCLWTQSQTFDGKPESSTGRLSLVFRRVGTEWKIFHTHTSPDNPDPSRIMPSERTTTTTTTTTSTAPPPATTTPPRLSLNARRAMRYTSARSQTSPLFSNVAAQPQLGASGVCSLIRRKVKENMDWMNQIGNILQQYGGAQANQAPETVDNDFDQFAQAAPRSVMADGIAEAFRSNQTEPFPNMLAQLFGQSNGYQRAGILNMLIGALGPTILSQVLSRAGGGGAGLAGLLGGGQREITPEQAEQIPPEAIQQAAEEAEKRDPSVIDQISNFYAEQPALVKTLGAAALTVALAKIAQRQYGS